MSSPVISPWPSLHSLHSTNELIQACPYKWITVLPLMLTGCCLLNNFHEKSQRHLTIDSGGTILGLCIWEWGSPVAPWLRHPFSASATEPRKPEREWFPGLLVPTNPRVFHWESGVMSRAWTWRTITQKWRMMSKRRKRQRWMQLEPNRCTPRTKLCLKPALVWNFLFYKPIHSLLSFLLQQQEAYEIILLHQWFWGRSLRKCFLPRSS